MLKFAVLRALSRPRCTLLFGSEATVSDGRDAASSRSAPCGRTGAHDLSTLTRMPKLLTSIFGSRNDRLLRQYRSVVQKVNALEPALESLTDEALRAKTVELRGRVAGGESLDRVLPEAFAVVREGSKRTLKMR